MAVATMRHPTTPDGRYFVVRGRLWRMSNPALSEDEKRRLKSRLGRARAAIRVAHLAGDEGEVKELRADVDRVKRALGERGPVWWTDGSPDYNRHMAQNTPYAEWFARIQPKKPRTVVL